MIHRYSVVTKIGSESVIEQIHAEAVWLDNNGILTFGIEGQGTIHQFAPGHWLRWFVHPDEQGLTILKHKHAYAEMCQPCREDRDHHLCGNEGGLMFRIPIGTGTFTCRCHKWGHEFRG